MALRRRDLPPGRQRDRNEGQIEPAAGEPLLQTGRRAADHLDRRVGMQVREAAQQGGEEGLRVIVRAAEPERAVEAAAGQFRHRVVVRGQDPARVDEEPLALHREHHPAPGPAQQRLRDQILQSLHLHAEGGLAAPDPLRGPAQRARLRHRGEAAQEVDVEALGHQDR
jgi:hypothetical protein